MRTRSLEPAILSSKGNQPLCVNTDEQYAAHWDK